MSFFEAFCAVLVWFFRDIPLSLLYYTLDHPYGAFALLIYSLALYGAGIRKGGAGRIT